MSINNYIKTCCIFRKIRSFKKGIADKLKGKGNLSQALLSLKNNDQSVENNNSIEKTLSTIS